MLLNGAARLNEPKWYAHTGIVKTPANMLIKIEIIRESAKSLRRRIYIFFVSSVIFSLYEIATSTPAVDMAES